MGVYLTAEHSDRLDRRLSEELADDLQAGIASAPYSVSLVAGHGEGVSVGRGVDEMKSEVDDELPLRSLSIFIDLDVGNTRGDEAKRAWSDIGIGKVEGRDQAGSSMQLKVSRQRS
jgi:hypothetical protein